MTALEKAAIELHDFCWVYLGTPKEGAPLHISGLPGVTEAFTRALNHLQDEIQASDLPHLDYPAEARRRDNARRYN